MARIAKSMYNSTVCYGSFKMFAENKQTNHYLPKVVRAVNEANRKRARMTMRQQRNLTITGLLVAVVIVFLVCHSLKLILNCYEVRAVCN